MPHSHDEQSAAADTLTVHTGPLPDGGVLLTLTGALDHHTSTRLTTAVQPHLQTHTPAVWLELSGLTFIDSTGITCLLHLHRTITAAHGHLTLITPSPPVQRMLDTTGIGQVLTIHTHHDAAQTPHGTQDGPHHAPGQAR
ncbi:STAS domain-containing protein [Streptomyces sp. NPDC090057]|uniref:STAS domain-containing protein n=1 Tax=Streptomyces sp. NPDC090057 TaxID=3365935 RepID=UPI0037FFD58A